MAEPIVSLAEFEGSNATAVRIEPGEDVRQLLPFLDRLTLVQVRFPGYRDGRGYSAARILREAGYTGTLQAAGDVLVDQINYMLRCGFDDFAPDAALDPKVVEKLTNIYPEVYQRAADGKVPIWKLRHG